MDFLNGLRTALCIDRLIETHNLTKTKPDPDPIMRISDQMMEDTLEIFVHLNVDHRYRMRQEAAQRERQQPGYIDQLNKQRASVGLPPI